MKNTFNPYYKGYEIVQDNEKWFVYGEDSDLGVFDTEKQAKAEVDTFSNTKEYIAKELGCKFRWSSQWNTLEYAPEFITGEYDEYGLVEEDLVGEEEVTFLGKEMTLSEVYRIVEKEVK